MTKSNGKPARAPKPSAKPEPKRAVRVLWSNAAFSVLRIANGEEADYFVRCLGGWSYQLTKLVEGAERTYFVNLLDNVKHCGCDGFKHRQTCKHVEALEAMRAAGKLV